MTGPVNVPGQGDDPGQAVVIGGGLAGIAAAVRLADAGVPVTLLESRAQLGGATYSFTRSHPGASGGGLTVDTGQHVFLRCYPAYRRLLDRLGSTDRVVLQDRFSVPVLRPGAAPARLARTPWLPAPLHLAGALAGYRLLTVPERLSAARAAAALRRVDPDDPATDEVSLGDWLAAHGQGPRAVHRLWELVSVAALNAPAAGSSLALAARVFRTGLLDAADAADVGRPAVSLADLHGSPAAVLLERLGVRVLTRTKVEAITAGPAGYRIATGTGELDADAVVVAVPHPAASKLVPADASPDRADWHRLGAAPIVNVHVVYDRRVTELEFAAAVDSPVQWVFDRTAASGLEHGQYLAVSISAADDLIGQPTAQVVRRYTAALAELFPAAARATVRDVFVTREPRATFRQAPGTRRYRPATTTRLPGLVLAGAWIDTGWPDTMEGAVRSGELAADALLSRAGPARRVESPRSASPPVESRRTEPQRLESPHLESPHLESPRAARKAAS